MNSINPTAVNTAETPGWLGSFARNQLLKRLRQMPRGYLLIEEGDELYSFGDANDVNGVKAKIVIEDASAYRDIAFGGSIGGAGAYMLGKWSRPSLVGVVRRYLSEADRYYRSASVGVARLPLRAAWSIATARGVYRDIGNLVLRQGEAAWDRRVVVSKPRKLIRVAGAGLETLILAGLRPQGKRYSREGLWNRPGVGR